MSISVDHAWFRSLCFDTDGLLFLDPLLLVSWMGNRGGYIGQLGMPGFGDHVVGSGLLSEVDSQTYLDSNFQCPADALMFFLIKAADMDAMQARNYIRQVIDSTGDYGVKLRLHEYKKQNNLCSASDAFEITIEHQNHQEEILKQMKQQLSDKLSKELREQMENMKTGLADTREHVTKQS